MYHREKLWYTQIRTSLALSACKMLMVNTWGHQIILKQFSGFSSDTAVYLKTFFLALLYNQQKQGENIFGNTKLQSNKHLMEMYKYSHLWSPFFHSLVIQFKRISFDNEYQSYQYRNRIAYQCLFPVSSWKMNFTPAASNSNINLNTYGWRVLTSTWKIVAKNEKIYPFTPSFLSTSAL